MTPHSKFELPKPLPLKNTLMIHFYWLRQILLKRGVLVETKLSHFKDIKWFGTTLYKVLNELPNHVLGVKISSHLISSGLRATMRVAAVCAVAHFSYRNLLKMA